MALLEEQLCAVTYLREEKTYHCTNTFQSLKPYLHPFSVDDIHDMVTLCDFVIAHGRGVYNYLHHELDRDVFSDRKLRALFSFPNKVYDYKYRCVWLDKSSLDVKAVGEDYHDNLKQCISHGKSSPVPTSLDSLVLTSENFPIDEHASKHSYLTLTSVAMHVIHKRQRDESADQTTRHYLPSSAGDDCATVCGCTRSPIVACTSQHEQTKRALTGFNSSENCFNMLSTLSFCTYRVFFGERKFNPPFHIKVKGQHTHTGWDYIVEIPNDHPQYPSTTVQSEHPSRCYCQRS